jgi:hypothetical protein
MWLTLWLLERWTRCQVAGIGTWCCGSGAVATGTGAVVVAADVVAARAEAVDRKPVRC